MAEELQEKRKKEFSVPVFLLSSELLPGDYDYD
jgi:hypothetical protein